MIRAFFGTALAKSKVGKGSSAKPEQRATKHESVALGS